MKTFINNHSIEITFFAVISLFILTSYCTIERPFDKYVVCSYQGTIDTIKVPCKVAKTLEVGDQIGEVQQIWDFDMAPDHIGPWQFSNRVDTGMIQMNRFPGIVEEEIIALDNYRIATVVEVIK